MEISLEETFYGAFSLQISLGYIYMFLQQINIGRRWTEYQWLWTSIPIAHILII